MGEQSPTTLREKEMSKSYKILVPKPASANKDGTDVKLYQADEIVDASESEPVRARNEDGTLKGDDPSTPDVNEAWEGGEAPKKTTRKKRTTKKKS